MNTQRNIFIALVTMTYLYEVISCEGHSANVTYEELEQLNVTCEKNDNCKNYRVIEDLEYHTCHCDEFCVKYGTCCIDSENRSQERKIRKPFKCLRKYGTNRFYFMVDTCDPSWNGDNTTEALCKANPEELDDLFLAATVSNLKTAVTYRNFYCAICNKEHVEQLKFWNLELNTKVEDIYDNPLPDLHYIPAAGEWIVGDEIYDIEEDLVRPCAVIPDEVRYEVHKCIPGIISACHESWTDVTVRDKCSSYMAILTIPSNGSSAVKRYHNPHCAICNYETFEGNTCPDWYSSGNEFEGPEVPYFTRNFSPYDKNKKCGDDGVYDTINKKCRHFYIERKIETFNIS